MRDIRHRTTPKFVESFHTAYDTSYWDVVDVATGALSISATALKLDGPAAGDVAGLVSKGAVYLRNARITVNVNQTTSVAGRAGLIIGQTHVQTDPEVIQNCLRITLDGVNSKLLVIQDVAGAELTLYNQNWTAATEDIVLDIEPDGLFKVYEGTALKYTGSLPFLNAATYAIFNHYIYLYAIGVGATLGYALLGHFQLDLDTEPMSEAGGSGGVVRAANFERAPIIGRLMDSVGTHVFFETDHAATDTPTQRIVLSRDVKTFRLEEVRYYMNSGNAVTSQLLLYDEAHADDDMCMMHQLFATDVGLADAGLYYINGTKQSTGAAASFNSASLPTTFRLERPGQVWYNQLWSGAPGVTKGMIFLSGREVD